MVVLMGLGVVGSALAAAWFVATLYGGLAEVTRVEIGRDQFGRQLLRTETPPGEPVNFLLVGTDSARGLDPNDPVLHQRELDEEGRSLADAIMLLRLDPASGSAWVLSIPRDLWVEIPGAQDNKITSSLWIGGPELLLESVSTTFDVEINHYVQLDFLGFREVVDVLGGVPVWFPYPARDAGSGLNVLSAGCHVLDGEQSLQYVRGRQLEEEIDGSWVTTGGDDFRRIERQQDFLVLALDRAIDRGARSPGTLTSLLEAGADSVRLDQNLTLAELIELGQAFSEFNPENLNRYSLQLYTLNRADGTYQGEAMIPDVNEGVLEVFRGAADSVRPFDVAVSLVGNDEDARRDAELLLANQGFVISGTSGLREPLAETVVIHDPDNRAAGVLLAQFLDPVPFVVESESVDGVVLALGEDYRGVLWLFQTPYADTEAAIAKKGDPSKVPDIAGVTFETTTTVAGPRSSDETADETTGAHGEETVGATATPAAVGPDSPTGAPTTSTSIVQISGRPPDGELCG